MGSNSHEAFRELSANLSLVMLLQPYTNAYSYGNDKIKEGMLEHVMALIGPACDSNVKLVKKYVVPVVGQMLGDKKNKKGCDQICTVLNDKLGKAATQGVFDSLPPQKK